MCLLAGTIGELRDDEDRVGRRPEQMLDVLVDDRCRAVLAVELHAPDTRYWPEIVVSHDVTPMFSPVAR